jgi:hypothetical protein
MQTKQKKKKNIFLIKLSELFFTGSSNPLNTRKTISK